MAVARYFNEDRAEDGAQHIYGVPARDLTDDEYDALPKWLKAQVDDSPLYRKSNPSPKPTARRAKKATAKKTTTAQKATGGAEKPSEARTDTDAVDGTHNIPQEA